MSDTPKAHNSPQLASRRTQNSYPRLRRMTKYDKLENGRRTIAATVPSRYDDIATRQRSGMSVVDSSDKPLLSLVPNLSPAVPHERKQALDCGVLTGSSFCRSLLFVRASMPPSLSLRRPSSAHTVARGAVTASATALSGLSSLRSRRLSRRC
jgi:hypothetical protein